MHHYWNILQESVCRKCIDGDGRGNCRIPREESCALRDFHPEIFSLLTSIDSDSYDSYVKALRKRVCVACEHQESDGSCKKRRSIECALDRYYPLIIDVAERVLAGEDLNSSREVVLSS